MCQRFDFLVKKTCSSIDVDKASLEDVGWTWDFTYTSQMLEPECGTWSGKTTFYGWSDDVRNKVGKAEYVVPKGITELSISFRSCAHTDKSPVVLYKITNGKTTKINEAQIRGSGKTERVSVTQGDKIQLKDEGVNSVVQITKFEVCELTEESKRLHSVCAPKF